MTPVVETPRLRLRGRTIADFPSYAAIWSAPEVARYTSGTPLGEEESWVKFARMEGHWRLLGYGFWLVEEKATGAIIGEIGLADFKRAISPPLDGMPEFGWVLSPLAHGKGYAREAVGASLDWAAARFPKTVFCCMINPENTRSITVAETFGFRRVRTATYKGVELDIFHRDPTR